MLLFQRIESALKFLNATSSYQGPIEKAKNHIEDKLSKSQPDTLGTRVKYLNSEIYGAPFFVDSQFENLFL